MSMVRRKLCLARKASSPGWVMLVKKRLPGRKVRIAGQRQQQPIGRVDKRRFFQASRVEAVIALCRRNAPAVKFGSADAEPEGGPKRTPSARSFRARRTVGLSCRQIRPRQVWSSPGDQDPPEKYIVTLFWAMQLVPAGRPRP